jgi:putative heme-binding domain-containing protein
MRECRPVNLAYIMKCFISIISVWVFCLQFFTCQSMAAIASSDADGFVPIFNGNDLTGWEGKPGWWKIEDGAITVESTLEKPCKKHNYLMWRGGEPSDFELRLEYLIIGGNSGIQFRSRELPDWDTRGYQADIESGSQWSGALFEHERGGISMRGQKVFIGAHGQKKVTQFADPDSLFEHIKPGEWNSYRIVAKGAEIQLFINGVLMSHTVDHQVDKASREGVLALQMHPGPPMKAQFRNLRIKEFATPQKSNENPLSTAEGFRVERIYSPHRETEGSWVVMCVDSQGRLIVGNQYDEGLFRVTLPTVQAGTSKITVEKIDIPLSGVQGLTWYGDSLYGVVSKNGKMPSGLYRVRDTAGDDRLDRVDLLKRLDGGGDHGWHGIVVGPRQDSFYVVGGNNTQIPSASKSRVPFLWSEDHLLPRMADARGHMKGLLAPGGCVYRVDPDGQKWELISNGFRNSYDIAFNRDGELFAFDSDMEWDMNTPWYRPTRVCHVTSGSEFGWRNGSGKWPTYYPDNLPAVLDMGPGSPTGMIFGYGSAFPEKYQNALYLGDWSYGRLYAVHLVSDGASYRGENELIVSGTPMPVTDMVINEKDGAMYMVTGGWRIQTDLYRITHTGNVSDKIAPPNKQTDEAEFREIRHKLESFHGRMDKEAVDVVWPWLRHSERFIRFSARVALEWQDPEVWKQRALDEQNPQTAMTALLALIRVSARDEFHRDNADVLKDPVLRKRVFDALLRLDWDALSENQHLELLRLYGLAMIRLGDPEPFIKQKILSVLEARFPASSRSINSELCQLLVRLESARIASEAMKLVHLAPTQEEQMDYIKSMRVLKTGWTPDLRREYYTWFRKAASYRGGASFKGYLGNIKKDAIAQLTEQEKAQLGSLQEEGDNETTSIVEMASVFSGRTVMKEWTVKELTPQLENGLKGRDLVRGRQMFGATGCFSCHRFANEGGAMGPDLTGVGRRFTPQDLLESILEPNRAISDLYGNTLMQHDNGETTIGRIVYLGKDTVQVNLDMFNPAETVRLDRKSIVSMERSKVSPMPEGLLALLTHEEVLDLMAYILAGESL